MKVDLIDELPFGKCAKVTATENFHHSWTERRQFPKANKDFAKAISETVRPPIYSWELPKTKAKSSDQTNSCNNDLTTIFCRWKQRVWMEDDFLSPTPLTGMHCPVSLISDELEGPGPMKWTQQWLRRVPRGLLWPLGFGASISLFFS